MDRSLPAVRFWGWRAQSPLPQRAAGGFVQRARQSRRPAQPLFPRARTFKRRGCRGGKLRRGLPMALCPLRLETRARRRWRCQRPGSGIRGRSPQRQHFRRHAQVGIAMNGEHPYDAVLIVSFGGPEGMDEVIPFLENVLRGKNVPRERMLAVAEHYYHFSGISPINAQNRALIAALEQELKTHNIDLPIYWGNRNWHPLLPDTLRQMTNDGIHHALAFLTSAYSSYSGCRQYREDIQRAQAEMGEGAPQVSVLRKFYNHPGFIHPNVENVRAALDALPPERRASAHIAFTARSIPLSMAHTSAYEVQLMETCRRVAGGLSHPQGKLVYQSRSGAPGQPGLGPDIGDHLQALKNDGVD